MIAMKPEILKLSDALVTAGLNGVVQGMLLLLVLIIGMRCFGRRLNATTRHALCLVILVFTVLLIPAHGVRHLFANHNPKVDSPSELAGKAEASANRPGEATRPIDATPTPAPGKPNPLNSVFLPPPHEQQEVEQDRASSVWFEGPVQIEDPTNHVFAASIPFSLDRPGGYRTAELRRVSAADQRAIAEKHSLSDRTIDSAKSADLHLAGEAQSPAAKASSETESIPPLAQWILEAANVIEATATPDDTPTTWDNVKAAFRRCGKVLLDPISLNVARGSWLPSNVSLGIVASISVFALYRLFVVGVRLRRIHRLKAAALEPPAQLGKLFAEVCMRTGAKRRVTLGLFPAQGSAVLLGFRHPKILLPAGCDLHEAEPVLRHELAHLNRLDDWVNLGQQLLQAAFFFHPGVWWLCRRLSLEREIACDDCVLAQSNPRHYALLLATFAGRMQGSPALLSPGVSTNKSQLQQRIDMILDTHRNRSLHVAKTRLGLITSAAACIALAGIYIAPRVVFAQTPAPPAPAATPGAPAAPALPGTVVIAPSSAALAGDTIVGDEPSSASPSAVNTGPKYKTLTPLTAPATAAAPAALPPGGVIALTPAPAPRAPMTLVAPTPGLPPATVAGEGGLIATYEPGSPPRHKDTNNMSIEERLDRLEHMIESLSARREYKVWQPDFKWDGFPKANGTMDPKQVETLKEWAKQQADLARKQADIARRQLEDAKRNALDPRDMEKLRAEIDRQTARAGEEMKRAARELERAMREQQPHPKKPEAGDVAPRKRNFNRDGNRQQLEGLRRQHEQLERQMEKLDRQIEELERSQEELEQQDEDNGPEQAQVEANEVQPDQPKQDCQDNKDPNKDSAPAARK